ncbi:MAG: DUF4136 domain-containing protein [Pseudomonadota bacterium]|nr:DUF4136 domain-containing protein [Pseudomonadota bacterium]
MHKRLYTATGGARQRPSTCLSTLCALALTLLIAGCATPTHVKKVDSLKGDLSSARILLMPMDVELSILTAAGLLEPQAEWTGNAMGYMTKSLEGNFSRAGYDIRVHDNNDEDPASDLAQLRKLHEAVGLSVLTHHIGPLKLPTKKGGVFDWTLGTPAQQLKAAGAADYALFVFVRDSYSSGGRVALQIGMAILGAHVPGGQQLGFASLVDLNTGNVVWFNYLGRGTGDLRNQAAADKTVAALLDEFPGIHPAID